MVSNYAHLLIFASGFQVIITSQIPSELSDRPPKHTSALYRPHTRHRRAALTSDHFAERAAARIDWASHVSVPWASGLPKSSTHDGSGNPYNHGG
jgi:hypothetical protein